MNMQTFVLVAIAAFVLAAPAFAVDITNPVRPLAPTRPLVPKPKKVRPQRMVPSAMCTALQRQLDMEINRHATSPNIDDVKKMRMEGGADCAGGRNRDEGIQKLRQGLGALGVKPKV